MARNKTPYRAKLTESGMYRIKRSRSKEKQLNELENLVRREIVETNRRLKQLERPVDLNKAVYNKKTKRWERSNQRIFTTDKGKKRIKVSKLKSYKGLYASKGLMESKYYKDGKIKMPKNPTRTELINLHKEMDKFLSSKSSTRKGIREIEAKTIETLGLDLEIEPEEAQTLYNFFIDPDFRNIQQYIKGSDFQELLKYSKDNGLNKDEFIELIKNYISTPTKTGKDLRESFGVDLDIQEQMKRIYTKYLMN